jgi:hypothetical protein
MGEMLSRAQAIRIVGRSMDKMFGPFDKSNGIKNERGDSDA